MKRVQVQRLDQLDLAAVVEPFESLGDDLCVTVEDASGRHVAGSPRLPGTRAEVSGAIRFGDTPAGRVVLHGPDATTAVARAAAGAIGAALSAALSRDTETDPALSRIVAEELAHGRHLQRSFVSLVAPEVPGYDIASHYEAAREVGGDFFDLFRLRRRGRPLSVVIADVTGKGIAAALLMAFSRPLLHAAIDHASGPAEALERTNSVLVGERRTTLFITALCARLDVRSGTMRIANAGHEPPLLIRADGSPPGFVLGSGPLIGAFRQLGLPEVNVDIAPGDVILFYTDGVTDARSPSGERFDEARLLAAVGRARGGTAHDVVREIGDAVSRFVQGSDPADDITVVAVGRQPR